MGDDFPKDSDGDPLRRIAYDGSDFSKPMFINFQVDVPDELAAKKLAVVAREPKALPSAEILPPLEFAENLFLVSGQ